MTKVTTRSIPIQKMVCWKRLVTYATLGGAVRDEISSFELEQYKNVVDVMLQNYAQSPATMGNLLQLLQVLFHC